MPHRSGTRWGYCRAGSAGTPTAPAPVGAPVGARVGEPRIGAALRGSGWRGRVIVVPLGAVVTATLRETVRLPCGRVWTIRVKGTHTVFANTSIRCPHLAQGALLPCVACAPTGQARQAAARSAIRPAAARRRRACEGCRGSGCAGSAWCAPLGSAPARSARPPR